MPKQKNLTQLEKRWLNKNVGPLLLLIVLLTAALTAGAAILSYSQIRSSLETRAQTAVSFFEEQDSLGKEELTQSCSRFASSYQDRDRIEVQFYSPEGVLLSSSAAARVQTDGVQEVTKALVSGTLQASRGKDPVTGERVQTVTVPVFYQGTEAVGALRFVTSLKSADAQVRMLCLFALIVGLIFCAILLIFSSRFIRSILDPISQITSVTKRIAAGSYGVRIPRQSDDELGELVDTVNDMSSKIGQSEKMQTEFISSVSHELRTPLTAISGWGETLLASDELSPDLRRGVIIILREAKRLTGMVEDLLEFTKMQDGRLTLSIEPADLLAEFEDTVFMYGSQLRQEGITLEYEPTDEEIPEIPCDVARMRQVFLNVLDNAAKHGGDGKRITASIHTEKPNLIVQIRDYGCGIPEEELPHIKMKFYKGSSKARGSGIGLAVCEEIVSKHGGTLTLENAEGGGTLVTISIPAGEE